LNTSTIQHRDIIHTDVETEVDDRDKTQCDHETFVYLNDYDLFEVIKKTFNFILLKIKNVLSLPLNGTKFPSVENINKQSNGHTSKRNYRRDVCDCTLSGLRLHGVQRGIEALKVGNVQRGRTRK
jgi:hypothetical protein